MAQEARAEQRLVDALVSALPTAIATKITAITTDKGVALPAVATTEGREVTDLASSLPHLAVMVDGPSVREDWMTASTDLAIPLRLVLTHHAQDTPALADQYGWYYARALELALLSVCKSTLTYTAPDASVNAVGVWGCSVLTTDCVQQIGDDRNRRQAVVNATVNVRTRRFI